MAKSTGIKYREQWLNEGVLALSPMFNRLNKKIPDKLRVSCGWPSKGAFGASRKTIGECWNYQYSSTGHHELFISPAIADPIKVLATLVHEVIHAAVGVEEKHAGMFKIVAVAMGLEGKMTATVPGARLMDDLKAIHKKLGDYPHTAIDKTDKEKEKKPSSMIKAECKCGYKIQVSRKLYEEYGVPECICGEQFQVEE